MKRIWLTLFLCLALSLTWASQAQSAVMMFGDDFDDGNDDGWVQVDRYWHVRDGRYHLDGGYRPDANSRDGFSFTHIGDPAWTDYVFEFTFDTANLPSQDNPDNMPWVHQAFVAFRVVEAKATEYRLSMWVPGDSGSNTCLEKYVRSSRPIAARCTDPAAVLGTNTGKVVVTGGYMQVYINEQFVLDYTDDDPIPYGGIGLGALWEVNAWFDDVRVSPIVTPAAIDLQPDTLNLKSRGNWVTAYIELPGGYDVARINTHTVTVEGTLPAKAHPTEVGDYDSDGMADLMVKFDRQALVKHLGGTIGAVTLTVSGELMDGMPFAGSDIITVINPGK